MRVLFVNPPPHQRVDQYDVPDFTRLGLACLASALRAQEPAARVRIVDAKFERLSYEAIAEAVRAFAPDVVGLTAFTNEIKPAARVARLVKRISSSIVTVIGGPHVSALPEGTLQEFPEFDVGVLGEGETTFTELCRALAATGRPPKPGEDAGLVYRDGRGVRRGRDAEPPSLDALPLPAWDLLPPGRRFLVMSQRGCPYRCTFCQNPNGRFVRQRSIDSVVAEMRMLVERYGPEELIFCDEIFTIDRDRTHRLLDAIIAAGLPGRVRFWVQTHVSVVDRELFAKLKAAGCYRCGLGIETGDAEIMRAMRKGITLEKVIAARRAARDAGLPVEALLILGHPHETWETALRTIDFATELDPEVPVLGVMVPYPGTRVAELARRGEGGYRLRSADWDTYYNQIGDCLELDHLSRRSLELLQAYGYTKIFLANGRVGDFARFAWRYRREAWALARKLLLGRRPPALYDGSSSRPRRLLDALRGRQRHERVADGEPGHGFD